jgi:hypothetical protein
MRDERGQATVELVLCLPFVLAVLAGVVEVSLLAGDYVKLWHAAREAARVAIVDSDPVHIQAAAEHAGLENVRVTVRPGATYRVQGRPLTVMVTYSPSGGVPALGELASGLSFHAHASMRIEQP